MHVSTNLFTCTHENEYDVLTNISTRTYDNEYTHLLEYLRVITEVRPLGGLTKDKFYLFFDGALQNAVIARH